MARSPKVTWDRVSALIAAGAGSGHGPHYRPLLEIKRWNPSPVSVQVRRALPPHGRVGHFFSISEWYLALLFSWAGADVREQFPLWPWSHPHPLYGIDHVRDASLPWSVGMESICSAAGIRHGTYPGTSIPYIWSIDLALTVPRGSDEQLECAFVSVKPLESERYIFVDPLDRGPEKLEAERQYAAALGIAYMVADSSLFPGPLLAQLDHLVTAYRLPRIHKWWSILQRFLDAYAEDLSQFPLTDWTARLCQDFGATREAADYLVHHCLWHQLVDADISIRIDYSAPPVPGGRRLRDALLRTIWESRPCSS